jgi:CheY-like chemotaxis protein
MANRTHCEVLVIDDDLDTLTLLQAMLQSWGFEVVAADNVLDGLQTLWMTRQRDPAAPCVVLLDLMMPEISGDDFGRVVRGEAEFHRVPPVIVLSGARDYARRARAIGAVAALPKPVDWARLQELITQYCDCAM